MIYSLLTKSSPGYYEAPHQRQPEPVNSDDTEPAGLLSQTIAALTVVMMILFIKFIITFI